MPAYRRRSPDDGDDSTQPSELQLRLRAAESQNAELKQRMQNIERSLRAAHVVLAPYIARTGEENN
jgi:hypothetical protein